MHYLPILAILAAGATACSEASEKTDFSDFESGNVRFVTQSPRAIISQGPINGTDEFRILAFRKTGSDFVFAEEIPIGGTTLDGTTFTGTAQLPAGDYKFLPSYGLVSPGNYTWPTLSGAVLSDELCITHTGESFPAAFMLNQKLDAVPEYKVSLDGPKQTVRAQLRRSVSRVDVLFIRADRNPATGEFTEKTGDDVFGPEKLASATMEFTDANSQLGLSGEKAEGVFDTSYTMAAPEEVLTMGTGSATIIGTDGYDFENVLPTDLITGSAHLKGAYLIPNPDNKATTGVTLKLTSGAGSKRTIPLDEKIPVERNKATLIRIYVLGDNVFTTGVDFAVEVDTVWDGSNIVNGEID